MMPSGTYAAASINNALDHPHGDRILVKPDPLSNMTEGGIALPETARGAPTMGEIVAVGPGRVSQEGALVAMTLRVGQQVLYAAYSETRIKVDGEEYLILKEPDIYAVIETCLETAEASA